MPIKIPNNLPAVKTLQSENIFVMTETRAITQDIRPLKILILNLIVKCLKYVKPLVVSSIAGIAATIVMPHNVASLTLLSVQSFQNHPMSVMVVRKNRPAIASKNTITLYVHIKSMKLLLVIQEKVST